MSHTRHRSTMRTLRLLAFAAASATSFAAEPPEDGLVYTCEAPDIRDDDAERTDVEGRGEGFTYTFSYVEAKGELASFDRLQREFAARQMTQAAGSAKASVAPVAGKRALGIVFELSRSGDFAGLTADVAFTGTMTRQAHAGWLLHVPSGRLLTLDDLFVDPQAMRARIVQQAQPMLTARLRRNYEFKPTAGSTEVSSADIDPHILEITDPAHSSEWQITLDHQDPCEPAFRLTFDGAMLMPIQEYPDARLGFERFRSMLKPEFHDALEMRAPIGRKPPFSRDIVERQFPDLVDLSRQHLLPLSGLQADLTDCSARSRDTLTVGMTAERSQWIYNGWYRWFFDVEGSGTCVVLLYPDDRGLTRDEAWALLSAAKRKLPVDESRRDPLFATQYATDIAQAFGGMPTFEHGASGSADYRIGFIGIDAPLQVFDVIQRRSAREEISAARALATRRRESDGRSRVTLKMDFVPGGRTAELAVLALQGSISTTDEELVSVGRSWMLHVPSGKLITFDDLFVDPAFLRKAVSDGYRKYLPSKMAFYAFIGEDREKQAAAFRKRYQRNAYRLSTPSSDHFRNVQFSGEGMSVFFSQEAVTKGEYPYWGASLKFLRKHLKAMYRHALDPAVAPGAAH